MTGILRLIDTRRRLEANVWVARAKVVRVQITEARSSMPDNVVPFHAHPRPTGGAA